MVSGGADGLVDYPYDADNQTTCLQPTTPTASLATTTYPDSTRRHEHWYYALNGALQQRDRPERDRDHVRRTRRWPTGATTSCETRQYVSSGSPAGDQEVVATADGLGRVTDIVTNATPGGTQTSQVTNCYEYCGALGRQDQQIGDTGGDVRRVKYDYDTCGKLARMHWPYVPGQATAMLGEYVGYSDFDGLNRPRTIRN